jgi:hypothetical protein
MKTIKAFGISALLTLGAAFAAPADELGAKAQLVQVVQALPQALSSANLSVQQAKALQGVIASVSGTTLTEEQARAALAQIQGILSSNEYNMVMEMAAYEPQPVLPSTDSNPLANDGVQNATSQANSFLSDVIVTDLPAGDRAQ